MPSTAEAASPFVSTGWLADHLDDPDVVVVDGSWYLPTEKRDPRVEYTARHVPGAVFFDVDAIADRSSGLPHMLPTADDFTAAMSALGIGKTMHIVVYDGSGLFSAPRVRWTLRAFGATRVSILEGGSPQWVSEGRPVAAGDSSPRPEAGFDAVLDRSVAVDAAQVLAATRDGSAQVVDVRPASRFRGDAPEPRPGVRAGHIPGSRSLPYDRLVKDGRLQTPEALNALFGAAGVDPKKPVIASCGSGLSAAILTLAFETTGHPQARLYDGSWTEWGGRIDLPAVIGE